MNPKGRHVVANGVNTYYEVHGDGEALLLLHGGTDTIECFEHQTPALAKQFKVVLPERRGHGRTADVEGPITYELMAQDTMAFMEALGIAEAYLVGWSDGAIVGMLVAMSRPDMVKKLVSIGGNFTVDGLTESFVTYVQRARAETYFPPAAEMYRRVSPDGPEHWPVVWEKIKRLWLTEPQISPAPTLVMAGQNDIMTLEHTIELFRALPNGQLCILPGASHFLLHEKPDLVNRLITDFLTVGQPHGQDATASAASSQ
jgi:pimeloyl-ACP methyl ester carboxylesterase